MTPHNHERHIFREVHRFARHQHPHLWRDLDHTPSARNLCERALKRVVLHRKNALFYKTLHGAEVGDLFMSLIHTCALNGVNAMDYLVALLRRHDAVLARPALWLPWNFPLSA